VRIIRLLLVLPLRIAGLVATIVASPADAAPGKKGGPKGSPTPTATVSPTPTASPTATVSPTPTATANATALFSDGFESLPIGTGWVDGSAHGSWTSTYNGYGTVGVDVDGTQVLTEAPKTSTSPGETHATLVTSTPSFGDLDWTVRMRTAAQLRLPTPNPWEVAWALWDYTDDMHFYYVALKPNGWELGKEDPAYPGAQRYLRTGSSPTYAVGSWHALRVRQVGNVITVWADGAQLTSFTDNERPYTSGHLGLYDEDSVAHFDDVSVTAP
jgi:hypothetical protein